MILEMDDVELRTLLCSAVRYAMCRQTYAPMVVADVIRGNIERIDPGTCAIIARDVRESIDMDERCSEMLVAYSGTSSRMVDLLPLLDERASDDD